MVVGRWVVIVLLAIVVALTVVRLVGLDRGFPLAALMALYPYVVLLTAVVAGAALLLRFRVAAIVAAAPLLIGLVVLAPRVLTGSAPLSEPTGPRLVVALLNLRESGADAEQVVEVVTGGSVDVFVALEVTEPGIDALEGAGLARALPHAEVRPSRLTSGGGIWSRHPLEPREPSRLRGFGATPRATIDVPGHGPLAIDAVHPLPPINAEWTRAWQWALEALPPPMEGRSPRRLLVGDFNATLDQHALRAVLDRGWIDAAAARGVGLTPTFSGLAAGEPVPPVTIDHVLVDDQVAVSAVTTRRIAGTDHRLLLVDVQLPAEVIVRSGDGAVS